jgi:hypothetical protein
LAEEHERELEEAKGSSDGDLLDIAEMYGNLVVGPHQVDLREETTTK